MLRDLVFAFDCDDGQDQNVYDHAKELIATTLGVHVCDLFRAAMDAGNGRFYLKKGIVDDLWRQMLAVAVDPDPNRN